MNYSSGNITFIAFEHVQLYNSTLLKQKPVVERDDLYVMPVIKEPNTYKEFNAVASSIPGYAELDKSRLEGIHGTDDGGYQKLMKRGLRSAAQTDENAGPYEAVL